ncbi:hypothetical protein [Micromonospora ureilytica]|uniref:Uncharacterized protein n=1 Tax=Micromonospora ureilytica TaxID=709868 RepID=A0ABS0JES3_9ACTN|nr:hypothetical protein [Micromonospora ureilytica]MBG6065567.1 hypothetical protein [Micromonospora ureilytica]
MLTVAFLPVFLSPLRTRRDLPESPAGKDDDGADQRTGSLVLAGANRPVAETPGLR